MKTNECAVRRWRPSSSSVLIALVAEARATNAAGTRSFDRLERRKVDAPSKAWRVIAASSEPTTSVSL
jgi:hypothetical protein